MDDLKFTRPWLSDNRQCPVAATGKNVTCDLIFIHEIDVGLALPVGGEKLRFAPKLHLLVGAAGPQIQLWCNGNQETRVSADHQNLAAGRVVNHTVGVGLSISCPEWKPCVQPIRIEFKAE